MWQIALIIAIGEALDVYTRRPMMTISLRMDAGLRRAQPRLKNAHSRREGQKRQANQTFKCSCASLSSLFQAI